MTMLLHTGHEKHRYHKRLWLSGMKPPSYSPDLASNLYFLFRNMKNTCVDVGYQAVMNLKVLLLRGLKSKSKDFYFPGISSLLAKWWK
jgi:hypothetical protein